MVRPVDEEAAGEAAAVGHTDLTHYPIAWMRVGQFLWAFATLEWAVGTLISKLFGVDVILGRMISANMDFRRKVNLARTALNWQQNALSIDSKRIEKIFSKISAYHDERKIIAHHSFVFADDTVTFFKAKAEHDLKITNDEWSGKRFATAFLEMHTLAQEITQIERETGRVMDPRAFMAGLQAQGAVWTPDDGDAQEPERTVWAPRDEEGA